ncbi:MAG: hypothetical protein BLITH_0974 [Brockia lithotrophica]|uniref:Uncharacterized protein n=1 Tax=Brockia lithotrophica TaxID=933949 RepID=A0A2T5G753_9BACL|nr:MAG: hypothetical protein BLITH_0974 [Brockia lithotrophica]
MSCRRWRVRCGAFPLSGRRTVLLPLQEAPLPMEKVPLSTRGALHAPANPASPPAPACATPRLKLAMLSTLDSTRLSSPRRATGGGDGAILHQDARESKEKRTGGRGRRARSSPRGRDRREPRGSLPTPSDRLRRVKGGSFGTTYGSERFHTFPRR